MSNSFTPLMPRLDPKETLACLSAVTALVPLVFEVLQMLLDVEILNTTTALAGVPSSLIVSSVAGLVTIAMGFLIVRANAYLIVRASPGQFANKGDKEKLEFHIQMGTWLFLIGLAVTFVAAVIISTIGGY